MFLYVNFIYVWFKNMQYFPYWRPGNGSFRLKEEEHEQRYEDAEIEWFVTMQFLYSDNERDDLWFT